MVADQDMFEPCSRAEWRSWLESHPGRASGIWVAMHKGLGAQPTYDDVVEEALAFAWIDSKANRLDGNRYKLWLAPRRPGSGWARSNKERGAHRDQQASG